MSEYQLFFFLLLFFLQVVALAARFSTAVMSHHLPSFSLYLIYVFLYCFTILLLLLALQSLCIFLCSISFLNSFSHLFQPHFPDNFFLIFSLFILCTMSFFFFFFQFLFHSCDCWTSWLDIKEDAGQREGLLCQFPIPMCKTKKFDSFNFFSLF